MLPHHGYDRKFTQKYVVPSVYYASCEQGNKIVIYRINPSIRQFMRLHLDGGDARRALGEETDFHFDDRPISYLDSWVPMKINFYDAYGAGTKLIPDISTRVGKMFLSEHAYNALNNIFKPHGEFLPVYYDGGAGYIFNCLDVVDKCAALDKKLSINDPMNDKFSIVFDEQKVNRINIFRSEIDFDGFFCQSLVKDIIEREGLTGVELIEDLGHPFPSDLDMINRH